MPLGLSFKPVCFDVPVTRQGISERPILLYPTYAIFTAVTFLSLFLLDLYIQTFASGSQPHSHHRHFIEPRPIECTTHLWAAFHNSQIDLVWAFFSRLQRAVSAQDIAFLCFQRSIRRAFQGVTPSFHSFEYQLGKSLFPRYFYLLTGSRPLKVYL